MINRANGFTLIELMIVVAIIAILASVAVPTYKEYRSSAQIAEGMRLKQSYRALVQEYYAHRGEFPLNNATLGLPPPEHIRGQSVISIEIKRGNIIVQFSDEVRTADLSDGILLDVPCVNTEYPASPIIWNCERLNSFKDAASYKPVGLAEGVSDE